MKRNNKLITGTILALAALGLSLTGCSKKSGNAEAKAEGKIIVKAVTNAGLAPYTFVDEKDELTGIDIEITREIFNRLPQYELQISKGDALQGVISGQYDFAVNNYGYTEQRGETYYYSYPYKTSYYVFIQRPDDESIKNLQDFADRKLKIELSAGTNIANAIEDWNEAHKATPINLVYSSSNFQLKFENIVNGKFDVAIDDGPILDTLLPKFGLEGKLVGNDIDPETQDILFKFNNTYLLFTKDARGKEIRDNVNKVLKELKEDGTLAKFAIKYFGKDTSPKAEHFVTPLN